MYLTRLILNPRSRQVRGEIADVYEMHRTVMQAFAGRLKEEERVLFRLEIHPRTGIPALLVQSQAEPDWGFLCAPGKNYLLTEDELPPGVENPAVKPVHLELKPGQMLAFRLRANPTIKKDRPGVKQGRRVGLVREEDQLSWLQRKIESAGARLVSVNIGADARVNGTQRDEQDKNVLRMVSVQFEGVLQVDDPAKLAQAIESGIGSGKGFGFGLLSLARA
jgi:CRISPR system Cascade subunit CasE